MSTFRAYTYFCLLSILSFSVTRIRSDDPLYTYCPNIITNDSNSITTYDSNSIYHSNLKQLLRALSPNTILENRFYNDSVGQGSPNAVYGLFQCRGDLDIRYCKECVQSAATDVLQACPGMRSASIWYDACMLHFSDKSIISRVERPFVLYLLNTQNITEEPNRFIQLVQTTMEETASEVSNSDKRFATKVVNFTSFERLYVLAECTQDISSPDCNKCFQNAIPQLRMCCDNKIGGRVVSRSCNIRYEMYPFFNSSGARVSPPPTQNIPPILPPPSPSTTTNKGNGGISKQVIIAIIVPISISLVLLFIGSYYLTKRTRKKWYDVFNEKNDEGIEISSVESSQYDINAIILATDNFSASNKIGEGGFGSVYKGTFPNGQEIAVKRLSKSSGQGAKEFKNEVMLVVKLQHRNLVRLVGFCLDAEEKILVYEFVPNKSLDYFLFG